MNTFMLFSDPTTTGDSSIERISSDLVLFKNIPIGVGAFGTVFRGELKGQPCAVKVLNSLVDHIILSLPSGQDKQDSVTKLQQTVKTQKFRQECEYLESFEHPNIVRHLATRTHPSTGHLILALELMDCNLKEFFSSPSGKDLPILTQKSLCRDVSSALAYIHSHDMVHRDLCSDNILLDCKGENPIAKVCDFGMSKMIEGNAYGHRGYRPPEARKHEANDCDPSYDIFSFGAIMVQIVCQSPAFKSETDRKRHIKTIKASHPLKKIITDCLKDKRKDRPSAIELERKLS